MARKEPHGRSLDDYQSYLFPRVLEVILLQLTRKPFSKSSFAPSRRLYHHISTSVMLRECSSEQGVQEEQQTVSGFRCLYLSTCREATILPLLLSLTGLLLRPVAFVSVLSWFVQALLALPQVCHHPGTSTPFL